MPAQPALIDLHDFAGKIEYAFIATAERVEDAGGEDEAARIREALNLWSERGPGLDSAHAMAQHALDTTVLTGAGLDGKLTLLWQQLAERHGPTVAVPLESSGVLPDVLSSVSPLRFARTVALLITTPDNPDLNLPGGRERLADLAALVMWSDAARDVRTPTTLERLSKVVEAAVEDVAEIERDPTALGVPGHRLPATRERLSGVVRWLRALGEQAAKGESADADAPWWLRLGAAMIIIVALSQLLAALGVEAGAAARAVKR